MKPTSVHVPADSGLLHLLHRAGQCADELFTTAIGGLDLTPRQYAVLIAAARTDDLSQTAIVDHTGIDRSTIADIVRRLVDRGLLQRRRTRQDARTYAVRLTPAGRNAVTAAVPCARQTDDRLLAMLVPAQRAQLVDALQRMVASLGPITSAGGTPRKPAGIELKSRQRARSA